MNLPPFNTNRKAHFKRRHNTPNTLQKSETPPATTGLQPMNTNTQSSGIMSDLISGFSGGVGSGLGHNVINRLMPPTIQVTHTNSGTNSSESLCSREYDEYTNCYKDANNHNEIMDCHSKYNSFYECKLRHQKN
jgi:hypothetical protein